MDEMEIWQAALSLAENYGANAPIAAMNRANDLMARGIPDAASRWAKIARAAEDLQRTTPREGEQIH